MLDQALLGHRRWIYAHPVVRILLLSEAIFVFVPRDSGIACGMTLATQTGFRVEENLSVLY